MIFIIHFSKSDTSYASPQGHPRLRLSPPPLKILGAHLKFGKYFVNFLCVFVKLQRNVKTNKLWLLTFQRMIFKFIDHRISRFYEYCVFSEV